MAIAIRAKQGVTRRHLLIRSAPPSRSQAWEVLPGLILAGPRIVRASRAGLRRAMSQQILRWCGREPTGLRACTWNVRRSKVSRRLLASHHRTRCPRAILRPRCCSTAFRPDRIFSTGCGLKIWLRPAYQEIPRSVISGPRQQTKVRYPLPGRVTPRDRAGASMLPAAACEPTAPCSKTVRIFSFIPAIISTPIVRSLPN